MSGQNGGQGGNRGGGRRPPLMVTKTPPSSCLLHNEWERSGKKNTPSVIVLRCRVCAATWKTSLTFFNKCADFYAGKCELGARCPCPHIYSKAYERRLVERGGVSLLAAEEEALPRKVEKRATAAEAAAPAQAQVQQQLVLPVAMCPMPSSSPMMMLAVDPAQLQLQQQQLQQQQQLLMLQQQARLQQQVLINHTAAAVPVMPQMVAASAAQVLVCAPSVVPQVAISEAIPAVASAVIVEQDVDALRLRMPLSSEPGSPKSPHRVHTGATCTTEASIGHSDPLDLQYAEPGTVSSTSLVC
eukprot:TRINITY_DN3252_c0_g2_i2.p1 TRINITY_DN3252_c0_g2~~TRINITY_DN3252_c0_g2_i2.p1  ORF type:complete len:319 (+),score=33.64 TRINITY_DN3252_c0_g2_i2:59-958(+)